MLRNTKHLENSAIGATMVDPACKVSMSLLTLR
jgi:hypothetical protein